MIGKAGDNLIVMNWVANPFRAEKFLAMWLPAAEAVLRYGATEWALIQSNEDPQKIDQMAVFPDKTDWDRYWYSEEISDARTQASGLYNVPLLPVWHTIAAVGAIVPESVDA